MSTPTETPIVETNPNVERAQIRNRQRSLAEYQALREQYLGNRARAILGKDESSVTEAELAAAYAQADTEFEQTAATVWAREAR